jgi:predicted aspartyl protease
LKKVISFLFVFLFTTSLIHAEEFPVNRHLKSLLENGDYFQFRDEFEKEYAAARVEGGDAIYADSGSTNHLREMEVCYFEAWDYFLFNESVSSNIRIEEFFKYAGSSSPDSAAAEMLQLHFQNDLRLFHYKTADSICTILLFRYATVMEPQTLAGIKNGGEVTAALKNTPPQTMERNGDLEIEYKRDIAALIRIPVKVNGAEGKFVMDTGANLSTLSESQAKKMGVKILDANFGVTSSSRSSVDSKLGVADQVEIGNVTFRNVIFIILPDKSLSFLGGLYKIKGIIGLPVIAQLGEVQIEKKRIFSPATETVSDLHNFGLNGNTPFANVNFYGAWHAYIFDTGAATSILGTNFNTTYSDSLKNFKESTSKVGGAGGVQTISILKITNLHYDFGSQKGMLKRATLQLKGNEEVFNTFYGIVGEDIFMQWETVTINFDKMFVLIK